MADVMLPPRTKGFQKGQSGNPRGSSKRHRELKGLRQLTHREVCEMGTQILNGRLEDLANLKNEPNVSVHKIWLATLVAKGIKNADSRSYHALMDRICGKPREFAKVEHTGADGGPIQTQTVQTEAEMIAELKAIRARTKT